MPRHKTPHHTDGDGIGKKLTGRKLKKRLDQLTTQITQHHNEAQAKYRGLLDDARAAGEGLLEVKRRLGHRLKWSKWRKRHLIDPGIMSKETCLNYMRVAREWNNPQLVSARVEGMTIDSINKFMKLARGEPLNQTTVNNSDLQSNLLRNAVCKEFSKKVRDLTPLELKILDYPEPFEELWDGLYEKLKHWVQVEYGEVYDDEDTKQQYREVREKIKRALNSSSRRKTAQAS